MDKERKSCEQYEAEAKTQVDGASEKSTEDVISMADSTITVEDIEGELFKIERIRDILVRRESELRYMMDDIQLCTEITRLKKDLQKLVSIPGSSDDSYDMEEGCYGNYKDMQLKYNYAGMFLFLFYIVGSFRDDKDKSKEDRQREEELLLQINKLVETRDFLVDDVEFERLREREEDREMAAFLQSKFPKAVPAKGVLVSKPQRTSGPFFPKTGLTLMKDCCGVTCSVM